MKKALLIIGIILILVCVLSLLYAALNLYGYRHLLDGTAEHYQRLHQRAITFFVVGAALGVAGIVGLIFSFKL